MCLHTSSCVVSYCDSRDSSLDSRMPVSTVVNKNWAMKKVHISLTFSCSLRSARLCCNVGIQHAQRFKSHFVALPTTFVDVLNFFVPPTLALMPLSTLDRDKTCKRAFLDASPPKSRPKIGSSAVACGGGVLLTGAALVTPWPACEV
jgi:hypothetical protein